jgi:nucleotide-binding universal stress UspA family protein
MTTLPVILVAVDGSDACMLAVTYISRMLSPKQVGIKLFHVRTETPEAVFDTGRTNGSSAYESEVSNWIEKKETLIRDFMGKAKKEFMDAGFPHDAVDTITRSRKSGIARDIINESEMDCAVVVVGRKGFGTLPDYMMGSIAAKLATHYHSRLFAFHMVPVPPVPKYSRSDYTADAAHATKRLETFFETHMNGTDHRYLIRAGALPHLEILNCAAEKKHRFNHHGFPHQRKARQMVPGHCGRAG